MPRLVPLLAALATTGCAADPPLATSQIPARGSDAGPEPCDVPPAAVSASVAEVAASPGQLRDRRVVVSGIARLGLPRCTLMLCAGDPCCNQCSTPLSIDSGDGLLATDLAVCTGTSCAPRARCRHVDGGPILAWGTLRADSGGRSYLEVDGSCTSGRLPAGGDAGLVAPGAAAGPDAEGADAGPAASAGGTAAPAPR